MEFRNPGGIYQQIANQICDRILSGEWEEGQRIPSLRDTAVRMGVNPNTVARAYHTLLEMEILDNQRGIGFFVMMNARKKITFDQKKKFIEGELPQLYDTMDKLEISIEEIVQYYKNHVRRESKNENESKNDALSINYYHY